MTIGSGISFAKNWLSGGGKENNNDGGGASPPPPPPPAGGNEGGNNGGTNTSLWDTPRADGGAGNGNGGNSPPPPPAAGTGEKAFNFKEYATNKTFGLENYQFKPEDVQKFSQGDYSPLVGLVRQAAAAAFHDAVTDTMTIVKGEMETAVNTAVQRADGSRQQDALMNKLFTTHTYMNAPNIKPVAQAIITSLIQGKHVKSHDEAIEKTHQFFSEVRGTGGDGGRQGMPGSGGFSGGQQPPATDWLKLLRHDPEATQ